MSIQVIFFGVENKNFENIAAIQAELGKPENTTKIKSLIINGDKVEKLSFNILGGNDIFTINVKTEMAYGYVSKTVLQPLQNININIFLPINWNSINEARNTFEKILAPKGYTNTSEIEKYLSETNNQTVIKNQMTNSHQIKDLSFNVTKNAFNNYKIQTSFTLNNGVTDVPNLALIDNVKINETIKIEWTNEASARSKIGEIISVQPWNNVNEVQNEVNSRKQEFLRYLNVNNIIESSFITVSHDTGDYEGKYKVMIDITLKPGYKASNELPELRGFNGLEYIDISWKNQAEANTVVNEILTKFGFDSMEAVMNELNVWWTRDKIWPLINNSWTLVDVRYELTENSNGKYTVQVVPTTFKPGYTQSGKLEPLTNIGVRFKAKLTWTSNNVGSDMYMLWAERESPAGGWYFLSRFNALIWDNKQWFIDNFVLDINKGIIDFKWNSWETTQNSQRRIWVEITEVTLKSSHYLVFDSFPPVMVAPK